MTRAEKVKKLKEKILKEIENYEKIYSEISFDDENTIYDAFVVITLKNWVENDPLAFCDYYRKDLMDDSKTIYVISDLHLDIMLDKNFRVLISIFYKLCTPSFFGEDCSTADFRNEAPRVITNDHFYEFDFISITGEILYEKNGRWL